MTKNQLQYELHNNLMFEQYLDILNKLYPFLILRWANTKIRIIQK